MAAVLAVCCTAAGTLPAHAAVTASNPSGARFAAAATPFQNKAIDEIMARVPGGTRVSANEVEWDGGHAGVVIPTSANVHVARDGSADAPATSAVPPVECVNGAGQLLTDVFCAYSQYFYAGCEAWLDASATNYFYDWALFSGTTAGCDSAGTLSWDNETPYKIWKAQGHSGGQQDPGDSYIVIGGTNSGTTWCIPPEVANDQVGAVNIRTLGWFQMTESTGKC